MAEEIVKFDINRIAEAMREKVKSEMLGVIPPEMWDAMIKKEIQSFLTDTPGQVDHWGNVQVQGQKSVLGSMIKDEIRKKVSEEMVNFFQSPTWQGAWEDGKVQATDAIKQIATEAGPAIINDMMASMVQVIVQKAIMNLTAINPGMRQF